MTQPENPNRKLTPCAGDTVSCRILTECTSPGASHASCGHCDKHDAPRHHCGCER